MIVSPLLYNDVVYIPTSYLVERGGPFFEGEPLESVSVEQTKRLRLAFLAAIDRGNAPISRAQVAAFRAVNTPPMLVATGARSWNALDKEMKGSWSIVEKDGVYQIRVDQPMEPRGWHEDKAKRVEFPLGTPVEAVIDRLIAMIQERATS
jgi:hypothetical protein